MLPAVAGDDQAASSSKGQRRIGRADLVSTLTVIGFCPFSARLSLYFQIMVASPSSSDLEVYFDRLAQLLRDEEAADQARTAALATRCSYEELAQRGLACNGGSGLTLSPAVAAHTLIRSSYVLLGLSVSGVSVGLGGKRCDGRDRHLRQAPLADLTELACTLCHSPASSPLRARVPFTVTRSCRRMASGMATQPSSSRRQQCARPAPSRRELPPRTRPIPK